MKNSARPSERAFTLLELLIVIGIIAILVSILLPVVGPTSPDAPIGRTKIEMAQIVQAINSYHSMYDAYPVSSNTLYWATTAKQDFTYSDGTFNNPGIPVSLNNAEVMAILMDMESYPNGAPTVNQRHVRNTGQIQFLRLKMATSPNSPGVNADGVCRDPWGNPYIISMDLNGDGKCSDAVYRRANVSLKPPGSTVGFNGLVNSIDPGGAGDNYALSGAVMVWSFGPDGKFGVNPGDRADTGVNKENVLSWK